MSEKRTTRTEQAIVDVANKRFAYYGYSKTTMDEIARDLGMGKASLYYYFPTKESLFRAVILAEQNEFAARASRLISGPGTASDKILAYVEKRLDYFRRTMVLGKFSIQTFSAFRPVFANILEEFARYELRLLSQILVSGNREGEFAIEKPEALARVLLKVLQGLRTLLFKSASGGEPSDTDFETLRHDTRTATEIFLRGIRPDNHDHQAPAIQGKSR